MLSIRNFTVRSVTKGVNEVSWEVVPTVEDTLDYRFQVLRGESDGGPWYPLFDPVVDRFLLLDNTAHATNQNRSLTYLLRVTSAKGETKDWGPASLGEEPDKIAKEVRRHWDVILRELTGRKCWLFPVRTFGTTCRNCYDPITQRTTTSQCEECYGTGFSRGFHYPIEVQVQGLPVNLGEIVGGAVVRQEAGTVIYASAFPSMKPRDLIVDASGNRWRVASRKTTERLGSSLHQEITVASCAPGDIEFQVPVQVSDLHRIALAAPRNYRYRTSL